MQPRMSTHQRRALMSTCWMGGIGWRRAPVLQACAACTAMARNGVAALHDARADIPLCMLLALRLLRFRCAARRRLPPNACCHHRRNAHQGRGRHNRCCFPAGLAGRPLCGVPGRGRAASRKQCCIQGSDDYARMGGAVLARRQGGQCGTSTIALPATGAPGWCCISSRGSRRAGGRPSASCCSRRSCSGSRRRRHALQLQQLVLPFRPSSFSRAVLSVPCSHSSARTRPQAHACTHAHRQACARAHACACTHKRTGTRTVTRCPHIMM